MSDKRSEVIVCFAVLQYYGPLYNINNNITDHSPRIDIPLPSSLSFSAKGGVPMTAYCMKCRKKMEIKDPKKIKMKNGKPATQGTCPKCGTKVFRIGG